MSSTESGPLEKRKLSELVEEKLLAQIQAGEVAPGDSFPSERELMIRYQVGRPAIREALQSLQRMGLVDIRHGGRARIAKPSLDRAINDLGETMRYFLAHSEASLQDLKQARLVFEMEMARIAARGRTEEQLAAMRAALDAQAAAGESKDFMVLDGKFHRAIAEVSQNTILVVLGTAIFSWLSDFHEHVVRNPGLEHITLSEHEAIFAAISRRQAEVAAEQMRDHLERANKLYSLENLRRSGTIK